MMCEKLISNSPEETEKFGEKLAESLSSGGVVALFGDLGSGKTTMIRGIARKLGAPQNEVLSPTFTIVHEYPSEAPIFHIDLYRIKKPEELKEIGLFDLLYGDGICLIEWPEIAEHLLPEKTIKVHLERISDKKRRITIKQL